jgi:hypothetical protein
MSTTTAADFRASMKAQGLTYRQIRRARREYLDMIKSEVVVDWDTDPVDRSAFYDRIRSNQGVQDGKKRIGRGFEGVAVKDLSIEYQEATESLQ